MHTVTALVDERKAIQAQHDALYLAVQGEVEHLQEVREKARDADDFEDGVADVHRRLQAILDSAGEKREVSDYGKVAAEVKALLRVLDFASIDDVDIPEDWASVTCENPGHRERQEDASWVCPDCLSGWWAVVDEAQPPAYHVRAFLRRLVAHLSSEQKGAD
jgi:rubrerythrin